MRALSSKSPAELSSARRPGSAPHARSAPRERARRAVPRPSAACRLRLLQPGRLRVDDPRRAAPRYVTRPANGSNSPARVKRVVLLPAPLGPGVPLLRPRGRSGRVGFAARSPSLALRPSTCRTRSSVSREHGWRGHSFRSEITGYDARRILVKADRERRRAARWLLKGQASDKVPVNLVSDASRLPPAAIIELLVAAAGSGASQRHHA